MSNISKENVILVPVWNKFLLTVNEASEYFGLGVNKIRRVANDYMDSDYNFVIQNGTKIMINRGKFEEFLNNTTTI